MVVVVVGGGGKGTKWVGVVQQGANGLWNLPCINSNNLFTTVFKNFQWALQIERSHTDIEGT